MNKNIFQGLVLAACMGLVSVPALAQIVPAPAKPANIMLPATTPAEHKDAAELHKQHAQYHKTMAEHHKSLAAEYEKAGQKGVAEHHKNLATHHEALSKEHGATTSTHETKIK